MSNDIETLLGGNAELLVKCKNNLASRTALTQHLKEQQAQGKLLGLTVDELIQKCGLKEGSKEGDLQLFDRVLLGGSTSLKSAQATQALIDGTPEGRTLSKMVGGLVWKLGKAGLFTITRTGFYVIKMPLKAVAGFVATPIKIVLSPIFWVLSWTLWVTKLLFLYVPLAQALMVAVNRDVNTINVLFDFYINIVNFIVSSCDMVYGGSPYINMVGDTTISALQLSKKSINITAAAAVAVKESKMMTSVVSGLSGLVSGTSLFAVPLQQAIIDQVSTPKQASEVTDILESNPDAVQYVRIGLGLLFLLFFVMMPMMRRFTSNPSGSGAVQDVAEKLMANAPTVDFVQTDDQCDQGSFMRDGKCESYSNVSVQECPPGKNFHYTSMKCKPDNEMISDDEAYYEQKYKKWANKRK